ncbi:putative transporter [Colletotrichum spaethianum]|uniref:Transporter n=1 Tax=Colletotrichum spaethianum TaxID=700344 RepID=A0AA37PF24_9PEZI|nr:putative transporter [Colletotrichum spaethianum]GKT50982.1 putative transporter [Colletotrichum spaethianum]
MGGAVFLIFGGTTAAWSFAIFFLLPDTPTKARFLNEADRIKAVERVEENLTGIKSDKFKWYQFVEAMTDVKAWLLFTIQLSAQIANGGVHGFGSIVIKGMGFSTLNTLLVQMLGSVFQFVFVLLATGGSTYFRNSRTYWMAWNLAISIAGAAMVRQINSELKWARFMGYCLTIAYSANFPMILSMSSGNFGGFTKKTTVNAMLFFEWEAPSYSSGFLAMLICYGVGVLICFVLRYYLIWQNKRRDSVGDVLDTSVGGHVPLNLMDKTDKEIPQFRYVY